MSLITWLPLIIMLSLVVGVVFSLKWLRRLEIFKKGYWMLGGYVAILLISVGIYYFIPVSLEELPAESNSAILHDVLYDDKPIESVNDYMEEEWEFPYNEEQIHISYQGELQNHITVAVERTGNDQIEAAYYQTPTFFSGLDLSDAIDPVDIYIHSGNIVISLPEIVNLDYNVYSKEFPIRQFTDLGNEDWWDRHNAQWGEQLIYLRIPNNIEISSDMDVVMEYIYK